MNVSAAWNYEALRVFWVVRRQQAWKGFPSRSCRSWNATLLISIKISRHKMGCLALSALQWHEAPKSCCQTEQKEEDSWWVHTAWVTHHHRGFFCCSLFNIHVHSIPFGFEPTVQRNRTVKCITFGPWWAFPWSFSNLSRNYRECVSLLEAPVKPF